MICSRRCSALTGISKPKNKFGKLLKNDFLASARVISLCYIFEVVVLAFFAVGAIVNKVGVEKTEFVTKLINASNIALIVALLVAFLMIFVTFFFVVYDFNKSLFSPQGYLSFTLPVSSNQLLGSKLIVYGGWMIVSYVVFIFTSIFLVSYGEKVILGEEKVDMMEMMLMQFMNFPSKAQIFSYALYYVIQFFAMMLSFVSAIYFSISLAHIRVFQKHSMVFAVIIFFVLSGFLAWLSTVPSNFFEFILQFKSDGSVGFGIIRPGSYVFAKDTMPFNLNGIIMSLLECVGLFFATSHVMHKMVNIK